MFKFKYNSAARERKFLEVQLEGKLKRNSVQISESVARKIRDECDREVATYKEQLEVAATRIAKLEAQMTLQMRKQKQNKNMDSLYAFGLEAEKQHLERDNLQLQADKAHMEQDLLAKMGELLDLKMRNAALGLRVKELERVLKKYSMVFIDSCV